MTPTVDTQEAVNAEAVPESMKPVPLPVQGYEGQQLDWTFTFFYDPGVIRPDVEKEILEMEARIIGGAESLVDIDLGD